MWEDFKIKKCSQENSRYYSNKWYAKDPIVRVKYKKCINVIVTIRNWLHSKKISVTECGGTLLLSQGTEGRSSWTSESLRSSCYIGSSRLGWYVSVPHDVEKSEKDI